MRHDFLALWLTLRRRYRIAPHGCRGARLKALQRAVAAQLEIEVGP